MNTETKALIIVGVLTIVLLIGGVFFLSSKAPKGTQDASGTVFDIDYSKGQKIGTDSAKLKLVEFGDLRCPACKSFEPALEQFRNNSNLQLIYRNFAFLGPASVVAANAALCAGEQGKFWDYHDYLYKNQPDERDTSLFASDKLTTVAMGLGLNGPQFKVCLDTTKYSQSITDDLAEGQKLGVNATPTFYINGRKLIVPNANALINEINAELKK